MQDPWLQYPPHNHPHHPPPGTMGKKEQNIPALNFIVDLKTGFGSLKIPSTTTFQKKDNQKYQKPK